VTSDIRLAPPLAARPQGPVKGCAAWISTGRASSRLADLMIRAVPGMHYQPENTKHQPLGIKIGSWNAFEALWTTSKESEIWHTFDVDFFDPHSVANDRQKAA